MAMIREVLNCSTGWLKDVFEFGIALVLILVLIDVLLPGTTGIITNVGEMVGSFAREGVVGLIALLLFLLLARR